MKRILIAIDDSPLAEKVVTAGHDLGKELNAEIALISVVDDSFMLTDTGLPPFEMLEMIKKEFKQKQDHLINDVLQNKAVKSFVGEGIPYQVIIDTADEWKADMIVIGTHGRTGLNHLLMGSVAEKTIRFSTIPIYVIPVK